MNTSRLFEMYNSTFQPALSEGKYEVTMLSHEFVQGEKPYVKFTFEVVDTKRKLVENRFEAGFPILVSHLRQQLGREDEAIQPQEFFNELIENKTHFNIWIEKAMINGRQRTNFHFLEPLPESKPNTAIVED